MTRHLGIDYGRRRIGLAISDPETQVVSPLRSLQAHGDPPRDAELVRRAAEEHDADGFVVGLPLNMDGSEGVQARLTRRFAEALEAQTGRPVRLFDERLTSFAAEELLKTRELTVRQRRQRRDALAAQCILSEYLKAHPAG